MHKQIPNLTAAMLLLFLAISCKSDKPDDKAFLQSLGSADTQHPAVDAELTASLLGQIPSPLEISVLLQRSGTPYSSAFLNSPSNSSKYNTNYKQALNLGVYGTDLGYTNIYEKNAEGIRYLASIKSLANELHIGQFFDVETIGKLAANSKHLDSLLLITTQNFNSINAYLQQQKRSNLSVLLLTGGWAEAMHITCQVALLHPGNTDLREMIGGQKVVLDQILLLLSFYESDTTMKAVAADFLALRQAFDKINITYVYKESTMEIVDGVAMIRDNSTTTVNITNADVVAISDKISVLRNRIIQ